MKHTLLTLLLLSAFAVHHVLAQELNATVTVNTDAIQSAKASLFEALKKQLTEFMNTRQWTSTHYAEHEKIECNFLITVTKYNEADNTITASLVVSASRPVYGSSYKSTLFSTKDADFNFVFQEYDNIELRMESIDNNLTAMMAYWAYLIIGMDMDTFAPMGGTQWLQTAAQIVDDSQNLGFAGWKPFADSRNRHAIINDYIDGAMEPYRQLQYDYHRCGLDSMHINPKTSRERIGRSMKLLKQAADDKPLSLLPQIFTDYKRDEIINIFSKQGTSSERDEIYDIVFRINASQNTYWQEIKN